MTLAGTWKWQVGDSPFLPGGLDRARFSLHGGLLRVESSWGAPREFAEEQWIYFDPGTAELRVLALSRDGSVWEGVVSIEGDGKRIVITGTSWRPDEPPERSRSTSTWKDADTLESRVEVRKGDSWVGDELAVTFRRVESE